MTHDEPDGRDERSGSRWLRKAAGMIVVYAILGSLAYVILEVWRPGA